jgi:Zn-dependent protease
MIFDLFRHGFSIEVVISLLARVFVVFCTLPVHEFAHAFVATKLGDETARLKGRLTLSPLAHIDPIGALMIFLVGFGYAKPVPVNPRYFKNYRRDMALTAAAGPLSNLLLGICGALVESGSDRLFIALLQRYPHEWLYNLGYAISLIFFYFSILNFSLCFFNLIPVPPFDGSRILFTFLPDKLYFGIMKYERVIMFALLFLLWTDVIHLPIGDISYFLHDKIYYLVMR